MISNAVPEVNDSRSCSTFLIPRRYHDRFPAFDFEAKGHVFHVGLIQHLAALGAEANPPHLLGVGVKLEPSSDLGPVDSAAAVLAVGSNLLQNIDAEV